MVWIVVVVVVVVLLVLLFLLLFLVGGVVVGVGGGAYAVLNSWRTAQMSFLFVRFPMPDRP